MESYLLDWANLLLRWLHVIVAIAWVGSSFYFVFLDSSLTPPVDEDLKKQGVSGELWAVHGGGFYHPVKFALSPPKLPSHLHWFYWESYSTWLSAFALLAVSCLWNARAYLIDPADPAQRQRAETLSERLVRRAIAMGGTCTGEHGIGLHKQGYLLEEAGEAAVDTMRAIKAALDPHGILNPGKVFSPRA